MPLFCRNECANPNYTTEFIHQLFAEEGKGVFSVRLNVLGHMQQGGVPSPFDRNYGTKMAAKSVQWFKELIESNLRDGRYLLRSQLRHQDGCQECPVVQGADISVKPRCPSLPSVCTVCVCARMYAHVCVCVSIFCIIMLQHFSIHTFFIFFITFSILMYIMCVCLFSTLSRRVGALQISIIIIIESNLRDGRYLCNCVMKVRLDSEMYVASYKQRSFGPHACGG